MNKKPPLQKIPSVDKLLKSKCLEKLIEKHSRERVVQALRAILEGLRRKIRKEIGLEISDEMIALELESIIEEENSHSLKKVINATGTIIHTNFGRAILPKESISAIQDAAAQATNLEYDLKKGKRGSRDSHLEALICRLTGAEAATVVNNNAAAVLIVLNTVAKRKEVIVSRGELVEIGGAFRVPDIIKTSGCKLVEVGTTNRTRAEDYERALSEKTGVLLKVHASNYKIIGFTENTDLKELVALGRKNAIPVIEDLGSGALIDLSVYGLPKEPVVKEQIGKGVDVVTFSGDKLLGGPQAGIIAGKRALINKINKNPLKRALRVDKITIAALEALFRLYLNEETLQDKLPALRFMTRSLSDMEGLAKAAAKGLSKFFGNDAVIEVSNGGSEIGSGSLPGEELATKIITIDHKKMSALKLAELFRKNKPPIIGRIKNDKFLLDVRCIEKSEELVPGCVEK
ncbi:MAG: L-seryl-tRNA(Sec) selenium transferase [Proteobacteria bacterium]|nr:L-seryl-tRNA(Sec) selenium transferase [Pseudomonadota bacterium]